ncbi:MAG: hypothetical protein ACREQA_06085 [Candidatus Binatia bacterium]
MENPKSKKLDPQCPKCQKELQRHLELSEAIFDEVDHGVGKGMLLEDYSCNHETEQAS